MAIKFNHTKNSTGPSNQHDAAIVGTLGAEETTQIGSVQTGKTQRNADAQTGQTQRNADTQTGKTDRVREKQRGNAMIAGWIAVPSSVALIGASAAAVLTMNHGIDAQANADAARAQAEASKVNVETGDRNMCNIVVISTDKDGNKTVLNLGEGNPNDPHLTGDAIAELIKDGKATGGNVKVGKTNEGTTVITLDSEGKIVSSVIPESCKQEAGEVFEGPKA